MKLRNWMVKLFLSPILILPNTLNNNNNNNNNNNTILVNNTNIVNAIDWVDK